MSSHIDAYIGRGLGPIQHIVELKEREREREQLLIGNVQFYSEFHKPMSNSIQLPASVNADVWPLNSNMNKSMLSASYAEGGIFHRRGSMFLHMDVTTSRFQEILGAPAILMDKKERLHARTTIGEDFVVCGIQILLLNIIKLFLKPCHHCNFISRFVSEI